MANDQDEHREGQDEGEYHFSDEQMNYEMGETPAPSEPKRADFKSALLEKVSNNRRILTSGSIFVVLVFIVYKMLSPSTHVPSTDIAQVAPMKASVPAKKDTAISAPPAPAAPVMQAASQQPPAGPMAVPAEPQVQTAAQEAPIPPASVMMPPQQQPTQATLSTQPGPVDLKTVLDKLGALEEQNTKMSYLLETDYPQKMSSAQEQQAAVQTKVQELATRVAGIETALSQITQMLQSNGQPVTLSGPVTQKPATHVSINNMAKRVPKIQYVVQAIIPGRAWLKSESGETVTVAEGDLLRAFGRITKIDPYDGIVEADIGNGRTVTLTYGGAS